MLFDESSIIVTREQNMLAAPAAQLAKTRHPESSFAPLLARAPSLSSISHHRTRNETNRRVASCVPRDIETCERPTLTRELRHQRDRGAAFDGIEIVLTLRESRPIQHHALGALGGTGASRFVLVHVPSVAPTCTWRESGGRRGASAALAYGPHVVGVVLTGGGHDGMLDAVCRNVSMTTVSRSREGSTLRRQRPKA
jgi:hypothetical protein